jgi:ArsR family transcriptional regulator
MAVLSQFLAESKALGDGNRVRLLLALMTHGEVCACQLTELLAVTGATVSRHLSILLHAHLIESRKEGRWIFYRLRRCASGETCPRSHLLSWMDEELREDPVIVADRERLACILAEDPHEICCRQRKES